MSSPGGAEVGRVSVRVVPDTSRFRRELERELKSIQRSVRVRIPVDLDTKGATAQLSRLRQQIERMSGVEIDVSVSKGSIRKATVQAQTLRGALMGAADSARRFGRSLKSGLDTARIGMLYVSDGAKKLATQNPFRSLRQGSRLAVRGIRNVGKAIADVDFRKARRQVSSFSKTLLAVSKIFGKGITFPVGNIIKGLTQIGRVGWITIAVLALIPPLLGLIAGLLAGLPSLLAAFGAGIAVIGLGIDGIKNAWSTFTEGIKQTRAEIAAVFESGLTPQFQEWARVVNELSPALQGVAQGLVNMTQGFTDAITSAKGMSQINNILENTEKFFTDMAPVVKQFTSTFLTMAEEGSKHFGLLVDVFGDFATNFDKMISSAAETGKFESALEGLAKTLDGLFDAFIKLFDAGLEAMAQLGGPLHDTLNALGDLVVAMMPALTAFGEVFLTLGTTLANALVPIFQRLGPLISNVFASLATALSDVLMAVAPAFESLVRFALELIQALQPLFPVVAQLAGALGSVLATALEALRPLLPVISDALAKVAEVISVALSEATPVLVDLAESMGTLLVEALIELLPHLIDLLDAILPLIPPIVQLAEKVLPPLIDILGMVIPPLASVASTILSVVIPAIEAIIKAIGWFIDKVGDIAKGLANAGKTIFKWFTDLPGKIWNLVKDAGKWLLETGKNIVRGLWNGIANMAGWLWDKIKGWLNGLVGGIADLLGIASPSKVMAEIGRDTARGLAVGINDAAPDAVRAMQDVAGDLVSVGTGISAEVEASGGLTLMSEGIEDAIAAGISGWQFSIDKFGIARMNRSAERDNRFGR